MSVFQLPARGCACCLASQTCVFVCVNESSCALMLQRSCCNALCHSNGRGADVFCRADAAAGVDARSCQHLP